MGKRLVRWPTKFLGRGRELDRLRQLFDAGEWLVTLVGPAGTGKTRLASRFAETHEPSWFCEVTEAVDAPGVCSALGRTLELRLGADPEEQLGAALAERGAGLVVFDNCEQVVPAIAKLLARWHDDAPSMRFLATSREVLRIRGEKAFDLPPLEQSEAVELFVDRARRVRDGYALTDAEAPHVTKIVQALEGLPLAIELSAARLRLLSAAQIASRLGLDLLADGPRDVTARQNTLRGAIDWSWNLLDENERAALAQCSVFRGGFTAEAAEAILQVSGDALGVLGALRDKSLVRAQTNEAGDVRLSLFESIREYAAEKLADSAACVERHAAYYLALAETLGARVAEADSREKLFVEQENLLAVFARATSRETALRAVLALDPIYRRRGPFDVFEALVGKAIDKGASTPAERSLLARAYLSRVGPRLRLARTAEAREDSDRAIASARAAGDRLVEGRAHMMRANVEVHDRRGGDATHERQALEHFQAAIEIFRETNEPRQEAICLANMGEVHHKFGRIEKAIEHYERAIDALRAVGMKADVTAGNLALACQELGRFDDAERWYRVGIKELEESDDRVDHGAILGYFATLEHERGRLDAALATYDRAIAMLEAARVPFFAILFSGTRAAVLAAQGKIAEAEAAFARAEAQLATKDDLALLAVRIHRGHLELAKASVEKDAAIAATLRRAARDRLALAPLEGRQSDDVRFAFRLLERALAGVGGAAGAGDATTLTVGTEGNWFVAPGTTAVVELSKRQHLRRLLDALARQRLTAPDRSMDVEELFTRGWPGERANPKARASRVHVALTTLRKAGLRDILLHRDSGYLLDPRVPLVFAGARTP